MSFDGQVLCQRMLIGPCARTTDGAVTVAAVATAAPRKNFRRVVDLDVRDSSVVMGVALLEFPRGILWPLVMMNNRNGFPLPVRPRF